MTRICTTGQVTEVIVQSVGISQLVPTVRGVRITTTDPVLKNSVDHVNVILQVSTVCNSVMVGPKCPIEMNRKRSERVAIFKTLLLIHFFVT